MQKIMRQDEIDALFDAAQSPQRQVQEPFERQATPFNFASAGQISAEQLRAISMLNDLFARNLTHNLAVWLRTRCEVNLVSAEQIPFNEFLLRIPEINYVASMRMDPLGALAVMQLDLALAPPMIDLLLGGEGKAGSLRELTDIEESILGGVLDMICRELTNAWQPVGLSFNFECRQMQTQIARLIPVSEKSLCISFEIRMPEGSGLLNLAFPAVVSNTILRRLMSDWARRRRHAPDTRTRMRYLLGKIRLGGSLQLCSARIPASTLKALQRGKLLPLPNRVEGSAEFWIGGQRVAGARVVGAGERRAAKVVAVTTERIN